MDFRLTKEQLGFQQEVREFIQNETPQELFDARSVTFGFGNGLPANHPTVREYLQKQRERGYTGLGWPVEYGGGGKTAADDWLLREEMSYHDLPSVTGGMYANVLAKVGTEEQKRAYIPGMLTGDVRFAQGWTEPRGGTDLAGLQTRAVREGDEYLINGQKIFTTGGHYATHLWLMARTDPDEPRHKGISMIVLPMGTPGIEVRPLYTQADERTNEVFLSDVRTPVTNLVGEENRGWYVAMAMADLERIMVIGHLQWFYDELVKYTRETVVDGRPLSQDPRVRQALGRLAVDMEIGRLLGLRTLWAVDQGQPLNVEAAMNKLWVVEYRERLANEAMNIIGPLSLARKGASGAPLAGFAEAYYRAYPMSKFGNGGGIVRDIIAQRGLGMPRNR